MYLSGSVDNFGRRSQRSRYDTFDSFVDERNATPSLVINKIHDTKHETQNLHCTFQAQHTIKTNAMTDSSIASYTCMGTKRVVIHHEEGDSSKLPNEGLFVVYQKTSEDMEAEQDFPTIRLRLATDQSVYWCDVPQSKVNLSKEEKKRLSEILLQDKGDPMELKFEFTSGGELKIFLKQQIQKVTKNAFRHVLQKDASLSLLRFSVDLGEAINHGMSKVTQLQEDLGTTRSSLHQWKETANKLEVGSTREKTLMLKGAYQAWIQNQARQKKAMDDLAKQLSKQQQPQQSPAAAIPAPDDWTASLKTEMPESMVQALAEGRKVYNDHERKPILDKDTIYSDLNKDKRDYADVQLAKRLGKARGAKKVQVKQEESDEEERPVTKRKKATRRRKQESEDSEEEEQPKKKVATRRRRKSSESSQSSDDDAKPKANNRKESTAVDLDSDNDSSPKPPSKPISKNASKATSHDSSETDDGNEPVQKKVKVVPPKADSDDSDSEDSLLVHMGITSSKKKTKKEESSDGDSDTDDGNLLDSNKKKTSKKEDDSDSDSDTDDGKDKKSGFALENSLFKNAKAVKMDTGSDSDF